MRSIITLLFLGTLALGCGDDGEPEGEEVAVDPNANADTSLPGDPAAGEAIYNANCIACHAADGRGNGGVGGDFIGEPERLAQDNAVLLAKINEGITGNRVMPPHQGILTDEQQKDALSYIRQTFGNQE